MQFTAEHYYRAARERIVEAGVLYDRQRHGLSMYVAGLSVECLLRVFRARKDPVFDSRHDLRVLFRESGILRLHEDRLEKQGYEPERALQTITEFRAAHDTVVRLWRNDGRFAAEAHLRGWLNAIVSWSTGRHIQIEREAPADGRSNDCQQRSILVDLKEKVAAILRSAFQPDDLVLDDSVGLSGYITSAKFRGFDSLDRQKMKGKVLRAPEFGLTRPELREILVIAALTPEEQALHTAD